MNIENLFKVILQTAIMEDSEEPEVSSPSKRNRKRFYSHQIDDEHFKAHKLLSKVIETEDSSIEDHNDDQNYHSDKIVCSDPSQLLEGISDMFVNSDLCVNYTNDGKKGGPDS